MLIHCVKQWLQESDVKPFMLPLAIVMLGIEIWFVVSTWVLPTLVLFYVPRFLTNSAALVHLFRLWHMAPTSYIANFGNMVPKYPYQSNTRNNIRIVCVGPVICGVHFTGTLSEYDAATPFSKKGKPDLLVYSYV